MNNKYIFGAVVVVVSVVLSSFLIKPVQNVTNQVLGAAGGSTFNQNDLTVGGVTEFKYSISMLVASGTPCAIQSPNATSTLRYAAARVASTSASAVFFEYGKATTAFATTTLLGTGSLAANTPGTLVASTTLTGIDPTGTFSPNQWLVLKGGNSQVGGVCQAVFIAI